MKTALQTYNLIPKLVPVGILLLGVILGFIWTYWLSPNIYINAEPVNLGDSWKQEYVKQVAWQFSASGDQGNATAQLSGLGNAKDVLAEMLNNGTLANDPNLGPRLQALAPFAANNPAQQAKISGGLLNSNTTPFLCLVLLAILVGGPVVLFAIVPFSAVVALLPGRRSHGPTTVVEGQEKQRREAQQAAAAALQQAAPAPQAVGVQGEPVTRSMSTYLLNDDTYDDSFAIETSAGKFLGEMGGGISKVLGPEKPKKVAAFEIWVFDTIDTRTMTKVLASEYAFNDPGTRQELSAKGELVLAKPGAIVTLETQSLLVQARVIDLSYGTGNTPPNSFFDRLTFELSAWPKAGAGAPPTNQPTAAAPAAASPASFSATPQQPPPPPPGSDPYGSDTTRMAPR